MKSEPQPVARGRSSPPAGGNGKASRPMSRASSGWDGDSNFGFDSDDSDSVMGGGGETTLFANIKNAWNIREEVSKSPEKEGERLLQRRLSSTLIGQAN